MVKKILLSTSFVLLSVIFLFSCTKQANTTSNSATFIKTIAVNGYNYIAVNSFPLSDGNYLLAGKDPTNSKPGWMVKFSLNGNILWQKSSSSLVTILWNAFPLAGGGYALAGFDSSQTDNEIHFLIYDNNGNILLTYTRTSSNGICYYPLETVQLHNGGFAFAGCILDGANNPVPLLDITDNSFNLLYRKHFTPLTEEHSYTLSGVSEAADGTINITGYVNNNNVDNAFLIRVYPFGVQKSFTWLPNGSIFETPSCIAINNKDSIIIVNSTANIKAGNGCLVNYKNTSLDFVSGTIGINTLDSNGNFIKQVQYAGYPNNGFINSINSTMDGGYILCGTVNQLTIQSSSTEIYVLKVDANLNYQWSDFYPTQYTSIGVSAFQATDGGYLISGYHNTFGQNYNMVLIKTDANGNLN